MKKLIVILIILMTSVVFAGRGRGMGNGMGNGMQGDSMMNLTPEQRFQKRTERKYTKIKKHLTKKDADKLLVILKKYDKKVFALMKPHMEKKQKLRKAEYANPKAQIALMEEGLELRIKVLKIKKEELKELKASGLSEQILVRIIKREMHHGKKGRRGHEGKRRGHRGKRGGNGSGNGNGNGGSWR